MFPFKKLPGDSNNGSVSLSCHPELAISAEKRTVLFNGNKRLLDIEAVANQKDFFKNVIENEKQQKNQDATVEKSEEKKSLSSWKKMLSMLKKKDALITE